MQHRFDEQRKRHCLLYAASKMWDFVKVEYLEATAGYSFGLPAKEIHVQSPVE